MKNCYFNTDHTYKNNKALSPHEKNIKNHGKKIVYLGVVVESVKVYIELKMKNTNQVRTI